MRDRHPSAELAGELERAGRFAEAAEVHLELGAVEAAARALAATGRYADASRLLLSLVRADPCGDNEARRLTYHAAVCLAHAGDRHGAASLFRSIGDGARADAALGHPPPEGRSAMSPPASGSEPPTAPAGAGRAGSQPRMASPVASAALLHAAHQARNAGRPGEAAALFVRSGLAFEAGICFFEAGDFAAAVAQLVTLSAESAGYRSACLHVIHAVATTGTLSFEADRFIAPFARTDPTSVQEIAAMHTLGVLYRRGGFDREAREAFERVIRADPTHPDAARQLGQLRQLPARDDYAALAEQDLSFWAPPRREPADVEQEPPRRHTTADSPSGRSVEQEPPRRHTPADSPSWQPVASSSDALQPRPAPSAGLTSPAPATLFAGRWKIQREIGRGGMGVVYSAHDTELGEVVALKAFTAPVDDPGLVARFKQEVILNRQLAHVNVIRLHDMGLHEGVRFITMELLTGESLRAKIRHLTMRRALGYLAQISAGLVAIHGKGIVHRDIKPANVFVTEDDVAKIMDFGLAKRERAPSDITVSGFVAGTPGFMPPEQITGFGTVTAAADIYALGVVAYELVTGTRPFRHKDPSQVFRLQFSTEPQPASAHNPAVLPEIDAGILRMLDRDPDRRPTASEVLWIIQRTLAQLDA